MSGIVSWFRRSAPLTLAAVSCVALSALLVRPAAAQIVPPGDAVQGVDQNEWAVRWMQWAFTTPLADNPLVTLTAKPGEPYPGIVFLNGIPSGASASRDITIGEGKYLFFPIVNYNGDNTNRFGYPPTGFNDVELLDGTAFGINNLYSYNNAPESVLFTEIDGVSQAGLTAHLQTTFGYNLHYTSEDNLNTWFGYDSSNNTGVYPSDVRASQIGFYLMLKPLSFGQHTLHFGAALDEFDVNGDYVYTYTQDNTYNINVVPEPGVIAFGAAASLPLAGLILARRRRKTH